MSEVLPARVSDVERYDMHYNYIETTNREKITYVLQVISLIMLWVQP